MPHSPEPERSPSRGFNVGSFFGVDFKSGTFASALALDERASLARGCTGKNGWLGCCGNSSTDGHRTGHRTGVHMGVSFLGDPPKMIVVLVSPVTCFSKSDRRRDF